MRERAVVGLILNYRDAARSIACIQSLINDGIAHVLVWDNSADSGVSAQDIQKQFELDERVRVVVSGSNLGFAAGINAALAFCMVNFPKAWALIINNDARLRRGGLERLCRELQRNPVAKLVFPKINHAGKILGPGYYQYWTGMLSWSPRKGSFLYASGCCLLIAPERMDFPLFDAEFFMYGEDCELGWRLRRSPGALVHVDEVLADHDGSASSGLGSRFYEERMVAAHLILVRKLAGEKLPLRCLLYLTRIIILIARAGLRSYRYRSFIPWEALWRGGIIAFSTDSRRVAGQFRAHVNKSNTSHQKP
jgi:N-acetylglucosaminyl-diphospho-decaprenol L-rhamnosyltransferase